MLFRRGSWARPPAEPAGVLLASAGTPFSGAAVRRAYELAAGQPVAVLTILKVYGSSFGLPNPGLLPTRRERDEQYTIVRRAIAAVERRGGGAGGPNTPPPRPGPAAAEGAPPRPRPPLGEGEPAPAPVPRA